MDLVRILITRSAPYTPYFIAVLVLQALSTAATLYLPSLNAKIIDEGVAQGDVDFIWHTGGIMLAVAFAQVITAIGAVWCGSRTAMGVGRDLRSQVFRHVNSLSTEDMSRFGTPTLITRGTNDVQQVQMVYMMMLNFMVTAPIMSMLVWVSVAVLLGTISVIIARLMPLFRIMQDKLDAINGTLREQITGIRVVRAFVREAYETERFTQANKEITRLSLNIGRLFVVMFPLITVILNVATGAVLWFGGHRVDDGLVNVGSLTAFLQYLLQILAAVMMGTFMAMMLPRAIICARRITEVLKHEPSITPPSTTTTPDTSTGTVEFRNVGFSYSGADAPVLENISFTARPGTTTAIIGSTGSGKTTLISLIPRLYVPTEGQVLIDATPTTFLARQDIVQRVSLVPQKAYLFSGTVASNLRLGRPEATDEELWEALRVAQADFVEDLEMPIAQGGTNVSGGQRQRLSIARMLVARPLVYLFDDSFSALDVATDAKVRAAMQASFAKREQPVTSIIVAQRVASIRDADQILVLDAGRIVDRGTHEELLGRCAVYQEIVDSQETAAAAGGEN